MTEWQMKVRLSEVRRRMCAIAVMWWTACMIAWLSVMERRSRPVWFRVVNGFLIHWVSLDLCSDLVYGFSNFASNGPRNTHQAITFHNSLVIIPGALSDGTLLLKDQILEFLELGLKILEFHQVIIHSEPMRIFRICKVAL